MGVCPVGALRRCCRFPISVQLAGLPARSMADFLHGQPVIDSRFMRVPRASMLISLRGSCRMLRNPCLHRFRAVKAIIAAILLCTSLSLQAQTIHKCTNAGGQIAFQQTPCAPTQRSTVVEIVPHAGVAVTPNETPKAAKPRAAMTTSRRATKAPVPVYSFECRSRSGAVFYRHAACPATVPMTGAPRKVGSRSRDETESVSARRVPRVEACRGLRSVARHGREHDEVISTYERNLGRDPCRRY